MNAHLSDDQLLERFYAGVADPHLDACAECLERFRQLEQRRAELAPPVAASPEFLAAQRREILARLDRRQMQWKWIPAMAAACALAVALLVHHPEAPKPVAQIESGDEQLFSDVYSIEQSTEPRAAAPIHGLFEENQ